MSTIESCLLRIYNASSKPVGAGFLVSDRLVVTCEHVVRLVQKEDEGVVTLDFPLLPNSQVLKARVVFKDVANDVVGLEILDDLPREAVATRLVKAEEVWDHRYKAFGFPAGHDRGVYSTGTLRGQVGGGWVQFDAAPNSAYPVLPGFSGGPVWDETIGAVIGMVVAAESDPTKRAAYCLPAGILASAWSAIREQAIPPCPYRGLFAFREEDAGLFFGREEVVAKLRSMVERKSFTALLGPSGSGKSSVAYAGLIASLRQDPGWLIMSFRPGKQPFETLSAALIPLLESQMSETDRLVENRKLAAALANGGISLADVLARLLVKFPDTKRIFILADQFEELFTPDLEQETCGPFLKTLLNHDLDSTAILVTMRADFLGKALAYPVLSEALQENDLKLGPMTHEELQRVIEEPAKCCNVRFEPGLVEHILEQIEGRPGELPLLEFALTQLWAKQQGNELKLQAYQEIGGVAQALARYADQAYENFDETERQNVQRIFVQLVQPGEGGEDTRRLATRQEIGEAGWALIPKLADLRLVTTGLDPEGKETVEVAHEALLKHWQLFKHWNATHHEFRSWQERMRVSLRQWQAADMNVGALLSGLPLAEAENRLKNRSNDLSEVEQQFIYAGVEQRKREEQRRKTINSTIAGLGLVAAVVAILAVIFYFRAERQTTLAEQQATLARAGQVAAQAQSVMDTNPIRGALVVAQIEKDLQKESLTLPYVQTVLHESLSNLNGFPVLGHEDWITTLAFSPDGSSLATGSSDNTVRLWNVSEPGAEPVVLRGHEDDISTLAFSPDGRSLATGSHDATVRLWDVSEPGADELVVLRGHGGWITTVAFSPDGRNLATGSHDVTVRLWDVSDPDVEPVVLRRFEGGIEALAFSPDGRSLATGSSDNTVRLLDMSEPDAEPVVLRGHEGAILTLEFSSDGRSLATGSRDHTVLLWDVSDPSAEPVVLRGHEGMIYDLAFSPDGRSLATGSSDNTARLWDVSEPGAEPVVLQGHKASITTLAFSPDGRTLASGSFDYTVRLWNVSERDAGPVVLLGHEGGISTLAFSPDGRSLATGSYDDTVRLWDVSEPGAEPVVLRGHEDAISTLAFSPDGRSLATGSEDKTVRLWDVSDPGTEPVVLRGYGWVKSNLAFSPDGRSLATGSSDNTVRLWDVSDPSAEPVVLRGHEDSIYTLAFSPDGCSLATGSYDATVRLWDVSDPGAEPVVLRGHEGLILTLAFSPDGRSLATGSNDDTVRLWDVSDPGAEPIVLRGHEGTIYTLAFSPDGRSLATGSYDATARLWDVSEPSTEPVVLRGHEESILTLIFSSDGRSLATGSHDATVRLWDLDLESLMAKACAAAGRNLTQAEWAQYFPGEPYEKTCEQWPVGE